MIDPQNLLFSYKWCADTFERLVSDVEEDQFAAQPVEAINHPAWLLGHITTYHDVIVSLLAGKAFDNPWDAPCGKNSTPTADRSVYPSKEAILRAHREGFERGSKAIAAAPAEVWAAPFEHPVWGKQFDSVAPAVIFLATTHQALHLGQLSGWRRAMNLPRV
ncbi:DinB superfamily protein [Planctomycetes bacterium MalM25]|nr:DinB superfamily protein [Planctomycetes bacterium MalM25]